MVTWVWLDAVSVIVDGRGSRSSARVKRISAGEGWEEESVEHDGIPKWTICPERVSEEER